MIRQVPVALPLDAVMATAKTAVGTGLLPARTAPTQGTGRVAGERVQRVLIVGDSLAVRSEDDCQHCGQAGAARWAERPRPASGEQFFAHPPVMTLPGCV
jgi:hypothetical protein